MINQPRQYLVALYPPTVLNTLGDTITLQSHRDALAAKVPTTGWIVLGLNQARNQARDTAAILRNLGSVVSGGYKTGYTADLYMGSSHTRRVLRIEPLP